MTEQTVAKGGRRRRSRRGGKPLSRSRRGGEPTGGGKRRRGRSAKRSRRH